MRVEDPAFQHVLLELKAAINALGGQKRCYEELSLERLGWDYRTFNAYIRGSRTIPGNLLGKLVDYVGWDWAWSLSKDERPLVAKAILWDVTSSTCSCIEAIMLYLCLFRDSGDLDGHDRLIKYLGVRFPPSTHPFEALATMHGDCLMNCPRLRSRLDTKQLPERTAEDWMRLRNRAAERAPMTQSEIGLRNAVIRDVAVGLADLSKDHPDLTDRVRPALLDIRADLHKCETLVSTPANTCFHFFGLVHVNAALADWSECEANLIRLRDLCASIGSSEDKHAAGFWARFHLASWFAFDTEGRQAASVGQLAAAVDCLRIAQHPLWELDILRRVYDRDRACSAELEPET